MAQDAQNPVPSLQDRAPSRFSWQETFADQLVDAGGDAFLLVPDKRLEPIAKRLRTHDVAVRTLAREEECVAYAGGCCLAGGRPVVLMQSSGLGNAINAIASFVLPYGLGIPLVITMRGTIGERNPSQVPLGRATAGILAALGIQAFALRRADEAAFTARSVAEMAAAGTTAAVLLGQELEASAGELDGR
jgi:sulfopyruvate decarboxylase alpha subunit